MLSGPASYVSFVVLQNQVQLWIHTSSKSVPIQCEHPAGLYCASPEKNPYPPHERSLEIPRGKGVLKVKIIEEKYEAKLEFPRGR